MRKYLVGMFEEERISEVRKTTNWNLPLAERVNAVLVAHPEAKDVAEQ